MRQEERALAARPGRSKGGGRRRSRGGRPEARAAGQPRMSPEQVASGALILSRRLAERSVAHGGGEAEI